MKIKRTYPELRKLNDPFNTVQKVFFWLFLVAAVACLGINLAVGGKKWSLVVVWALISVWNMVLSPDLIEVNIISQTVKALFYVVVELFLIDKLLAPGWANFVIPIVIFSVQIFIAIIFFLDTRKGKSNSLPIVTLIIVTMVAFAAVYFHFHGVNWPMIVMFSLSLLMSLVGFFGYREDFKRELRKQFHTE
ncbi:MAG: hypothetical protein II161_02860 [Erysipelotrichaceae bacterium]|nr:hypothetical protein [Erysipelotrichaceae bacterium]